MTAVRRPRAVPLPALVLALVLALVVLGGAAAIGAAVTGAAAVPAIADPGPVVRWGLPLAGAVDDLAAAVTVGVLVLTGTALPAEPGRASGRRAHAPALRVACGAGVMWALAGTSRLVLGYAAATGQTLQQPDLGTQLVSYVTQVEAGRWAAAAVVLTALVATICAGAARLSTTRLLVVPALAALVAEVVAGHAGSGGLSAAGAGGTGTVVVIGLHVAGVALWIGPVAGLLLLAPGLGDRAGPAAAGYGRLAGWASGFVAVSGALAAWQQLGGASGVRTAYGALVGAKVLVLVVLVALALRHRRRVLPAVAAGDPGALARAAAAELLVAALAIGLSAALATTDPPAAVGTALAAVGGP